MSCEYSTWPRVSVAELIESGVILRQKDGNYGSKYPRASEFGAKGIPFLTASSLSDGEIDIEGAPRLPEHRSVGLEYGFVEPNDVLLSHNATVGRVAIVPDWDARLMVGTSLTYYRVDTDRLLPGYLAAYFVAADFQNQLAAVMSHTTRNQVPITAQRHLEIVVPPMAVQRGIAHTLGSINSKIANNRALAADLEAIARAIFKSWFVDFDPVKANMEGRPPVGMDADTAALFPDELIESELGSIPKGWEVASLDSKARLDTTSVKPFDQPETKWSHYSIPAFDDGGYPANDLGSEIKSGKHLVNPEAILISKLNPSQWRCWRPDPLIVDEHAICSPEFMQIVGKDVSRNWIWGLCHSQKFKDQVNSTTDGTTGSRQRAKPKVVMQQLVVFPAADIEKLYNDTVRPILNRVDVLSHETQELVSLRDNLLPRLISGRLRLPGSENKSNESYSDV